MILQGERGDPALHSRMRQATKTVVKGPRAKEAGTELDTSPVSAATPLVSRCPELTLSVRTTSSLLISTIQLLLGEIAQD